MRRQRSTRKSPIGSSAYASSVRNGHQGEDVRGGESSIGTQEIRELPDAPEHKTGKNPTKSGSLSLRGINSKTASEVSEEQERGIRELAQQGMTERLAREEVLLGKGRVEP
jgi:hypothetical protein